MTDTLEPLTTMILAESYNIMESPLIDLSKLSSMSDATIRAAYLATILASLVLYRAGDRISKRALRDPQGKSLSRYMNTMSPLNFWGMVVHNSDSKQLETVLQPETVKSLKTTSGRIIRDHIKAIHYPISIGNNDIKWDEMMDAVRVMTLRLPLRTPRINKIRDGLNGWASLENNEKNQIISLTFYLLMESDPNSILLTRLRAIANSSLLDISKEDDKVIDVVKIVGNKVTNVVSATAVIKLMKEDGEGGGEGGVAMGAIGDTTTSSTDIAFEPFRLFKNKIIRRMKRSFTRLKSYENVKKKRKNLIKK